MSYNFKERIRKSFTSMSSISIPYVTGPIEGRLDIYELNSSKSSDLASLNLVNNSLCYKDVDLDINKYTKILNSLIPSKSKVLWMGFDIDKKYFIVIYKYKLDKHVIYWIPTKDQFNVIDKFILPTGKHLEGKFIKLVNGKDK